jgi:hypothetical protein
MVSLAMVVSNELVEGTEEPTHPRDGLGASA